MAPFSDTEDSADDRELVRDVDEDAVVEDDDDDGEDLFGQDMEAYVHTPRKFSGL